MSTILFDQIVFGPIISRRLGVSLGVNLLLTNGKVCSFNCIYCECGLNEERRAQGKLPTRQQVYDALKAKLEQLTEEKVTPDVITFAGNGEPTVHPEFAAIIDDTIELRNTYFPNAKISVLSNATRIDRDSVVEALKKVDNNILKLDSMLDDKMRLINAPNSPSFSVEKLIPLLKRFDGKLIIQTMFLKGTCNGVSVDNTSAKEVELWLNALKEVKPQSVMIYTIDRETPIKELQKASKEVLDSIAEKVKEAGFEVSVSY